MVNILNPLLKKHVKVQYYMGGPPGKGTQRLVCDFPAGRGLYLCWEAKEKRPLPRSDTFSVAHVQELP